MTRSLPAKLVLALTLALATGSGALADMPDTPAEAFERALSRFAGGDVSGADQALEDATEQGFEVRHPSVDVIRASSGDPASIGRLVRMGWRVNTGGPWLLLSAARGLLEDHPVLAASLASSVTGKTPSGRAAHSFVVRTLHQIGATELAGQKLAESFGDPSNRVKDIPRRVLAKLPAKRDALYETERGWMWLDAGAHARAVAVFNRALHLEREDGSTRCWALAGAGRAALRGARYESGWDYILEAFQRCKDLPMAEENEVFIARMAFGRRENALMNEAFERLKARGPNHLRQHGLDVLETLESAEGGLLFLTRRLRTRYRRFPFRDGLNEVASKLWQSYDARGKHKLAIEMIQPLVDAGYLARRERSQGQLAVLLARTYTRLRKPDLAKKSLIHAAYHHPLTWYGILALDELRASDPYLARATEHTVPPVPVEPPLEATWEESPETSALRERLRVLSSYGLADAVLLEAQAANVHLHAGRAASVGRLLLEMGAPREASRLAHEALADLGVHSPLDGLGELWRLAYPQPFQAFVERHAEVQEIDPRLAWAVMRIESRYATMAESYAGAKGLLQVMPSTARWLASMRLEPTESIDLFDPLRNIELGVDLLGRLKSRFDSDIPVMIVAYNAGAGRTRKWQRRVRADSLGSWVERLPIAQAKNYVRSVVSAWAMYRYLDGEPIGLAPPTEPENLAQNR